VLRVGDRVAGKYRVERQLGQGGMGAVYVAVNEVLDKRVALKVMTGAFASSPDAVQRFFREAMSASRVRHPAIVEIYDAGTHEGAPWMAMELLQGQSLAQRLERGPLALGEVMPIFGPVLSALEAVHQQGIVHRDLKPDNVFLEQLADGRMAPKLLDFGIAKTTNDIHKLTATGAVMGTAHYLAPEQARDSSAVDPRTDLYAIGVVLYECLSGRMPHDASTLPELIAKLIMEDPAPLLRVAPHVPAQLANVVHWCLARDAASRPQRAADLAHHLGLALEHVPPTPTVLGPSTPGARSSTGQADPAAAAALAAFGAGPTGPSQHGTALLPQTGGVGPTSPLGPASPTPPFGAFGTPPPPSGFGPPAFGASPAFGAAPTGFGPPAYAAPARPKSSSMKPLVLIVGLFVLGTACVTIAPFVIAIVGAMSAFSGFGGGGFGPQFPERWDINHSVLLRDVNGDTATDIVGWKSRIVNYDMRYYLCAHDGRSGEELWCHDVGEQSSFSDSVTVYLADRVVFFDERGQSLGVRLADGADLGYAGSVRGEPEEACVTADAVAVRTTDGLWSQLRVADGSISPPAAQQPPSCRPAEGKRPGGWHVVTGDGDWTELDHARRPRLRGTPFQLRAAWQRASTGEVMALGVAPAEGRSAGALARMLGDGIVWQVTVPQEPLMAQDGAPEGAALFRDTVFVSYEMTARAGVPRRLAAFRLADGARLWDVPVPAARGGQAYYVGATADLAVVTTNGALVAVDPRTGAQRFSIGEAY
jgi:serine/threonine protein kinase/outer membrane protein assembly factor BamB